MRHGSSAYFLRRSNLIKTRNTLSCCYCSLGRNDCGVLSWSYKLSHSHTDTHTNSRTLVLSFTLAFSLSEIKEAFIIQETLHSHPGWMDDVIHGPCTDELLLSFLIVLVGRKKGRFPLLRFRLFLAPSLLVACMHYNYNAPCSINTAVRFSSFYFYTVGLAAFTPLFLFPFLV